MSRVLSTLRNHWKKSIFFTAAGSYGVHYASVKVRENQIMREICKEAQQYGEIPVGNNAPLYKVTVILNPAADGGRARKKYEKYCAPVLHLAGLKVHVVRTEAEGQAKDLLELISADGADDGRMPDAVLVAGGDGTVMEAVTGFMRRPDADRIRTKMPLGVLPVGNLNRLARNLHPDVSTSLSDVELMARSAMSIVKQLRRPMDVLQVENIGQDQAFSGKKIFGMSEVQLGAFRDAHDRLSKYWYWAGLKRAMAYVFGFTTAAKMHLWNCRCQLEYAVPSAATEAAETKPEPVQQPSSWWSFFLFSSPTSNTLTQEQSPPSPTYEWETESGFAGVEIAVRTPNAAPLAATDGDGTLGVALGPESVGFADFVREGWRRETGASDPLRCCNADGGGWRELRTPSLRLRPEFGREDDAEERDVHFSLDGESVEVRGDLELTLLRDRMVMFCSRAAAKEVREEEQQGLAGKRWWQQRSTRMSQPMASVDKRLGGAL